MTKFVVLAAGRGSRLGRFGDELPKCLLPIDGRAVLSHQFELAPPGADLVVVVGYRADQVEEYVRLAHPDLDVTFVREPNWGRGPGASLLEARDVVGDEHMVFTACDTLWEPDWQLWTGDSSWLAVAPIPAGTPAARWCRIVPSNDGNYAIGVADKTPHAEPTELAWTAFGCVVRDDLRRFWAGLVDAETRAGEIQLSSGVDAIVNGGYPVQLRHVAWLDVGDEQAYRRAVATVGGYDALKPDQVTYVTPGRRVVKFHSNPDKVRWRAERAELLGDVVPKLVDPVGTTMVAYDYVPGATAYQVADRQGVHVVQPLLDWWTEHFWTTQQRDEFPPEMHNVATKFYRDKTFARVMSLDAPLRSVALDAITRVDWNQLVDGCVPGVFHGDLTYANVIVHDDDWNLGFVTIDWREDFAGVTRWGDLRYDLGKLMSGTVMHWERASYGDFRRWDDGPRHRALIEAYVTDHLAPSLVFRSRSRRAVTASLLRDVQLIAALCLVNSAALHAAPMDEILVARGCRWLEEVT